MFTGTIKENIRYGILDATDEEVYAAADYITIHVPLMDSTRNTINAETIAQMKDGVIILNFARGGLVNNADIKKAFATLLTLLTVKQSPNRVL